MIEGGPTLGQVGPSVLAERQDAAVAAEILARSSVMKRGSGTPRRREEAIDLVSDAAAPGTRGVRRPRRGCLAMILGSVIAVLTVLLDMQ
jgi:hypothetical protein